VISKVVLFYDDKIIFFHEDKIFCLFISSGITCYECMLSFILNFHYVLFSLYLIFIISYFYYILFSLCLIFIISYFHYILFSLYLIFIISYFHYVLFSLCLIFINLFLLTFLVFWNQSDYKDLQLTNKELQMKIIQDRYFVVVYNSIYYFCLSFL
jgi:hypothetical protein